MVNKSELIDLEIKQIKSLNPSPREQEIDRRRNLSATCGYIAAMVFIVFVCVLAICTIIYL